MRAGVLRKGAKARCQVAKHRKDPRKQKAPWRRLRGKGFCYKSLFSLVPFTHWHFCPSFLTELKLHPSREPSENAPFTIPVLPQSQTTLYSYTSLLRLVFSEMLWTPLLFSRTSLPPEPLTPPRLSLELPPPFCPSPPTHTSRVLGRYGCPRSSEDHDKECEFQRGRGRPDDLRRGSSELGVPTGAWLLPGLFPARAGTLDLPHLCRHPQNVQGVESSDGSASSGPAWPTVIDHLTPRFCTKYIACITSISLQNNPLRWTGLLSPLYR